MLYLLKLVRNSYLRGIMVKRQAFNDTVLMHHGGCIVIQEEYEAPTKKSRWRLQKCSSYLTNGTWL